MKKLFISKARDYRCAEDILKGAGFNFLADLTATDNLTLGGFERFAVVYHLLSHASAERVTVKAYVPQDNPVLPSIELLWKTADWQEREVFDLFGIKFKDIQFDRL
ncbi:MAG: hypothetical protein CM1200mP10_00300 [Candidatus Neomarinimicrobiota bacterium]|nr:MAG: hypothetical protein CM1200mP10_00300 [Candidatus Neomarinimicrobiota bacterium]